MIENEMKINLGKSKAVSFTKAKVKKQIRYYFWGQLILEASSFKYSGIIICNDLNWADDVNYTLQRAWKALHFIMHTLKKGNDNMKHLAYMALLGPILEYGAVCCDPYIEGQVSALNRVQKQGLAQRRSIAQMCALFKAYTKGRAWRAIGDRLLKPCYLSREAHNW